MNTDILKVIEQQIDQNPVILYMKGDATNPQCGFSASVVRILRDLQISFKTVNVLEDQDIRQGIKDYSGWPTIPQLYIQKQFVGGCDIVNSLHEKGELVELFKNLTPEETA